MKLYSNPEKDFNERDDLEPNDFNHITNVYETEKDSVKIFVALGQKKESSDDLVYYPIYLILKTKQVKKIGIIEGDFTIDWQSKQIKLQPNYFTFVTKAYLTQVALSDLNELESEITNWINKLYNSKSFDIQTTMPRTSDSLFHAIINSGITTDSVERLRSKFAEQPTEASFKDMKETTHDFQNPFINDEILKKMADCRTLEDLRAYIRSPNYWPINDVVGIDFPKMFDVDMIIFFESNKVVQCLPLTGRDKIVLLNYSVDEKNRFYFDLVKYEGKRTLSPAEFERTPMYLACQQQEGGGGGKKKETKNAADNLVFVISNGNGNHQTTKIKLTPGRFPGESIELVDIPAFSALDEIPQWRNKLATHWPAPFSLNNFRWASVEHFLQAYKFEYAHPEFFQLFSLNSGSEISKSAEMAKFVADIATKEEEEQDAIQHNNHLNPVLIEKELQVVPRRIQIDPLYKEKKKQWKFDAQYAKFNQNEEMRKILCATKHAKLVYFQHSRPPKAAKDLMRIRQILCVP